MSQRWIYAFDHFLLDDKTRLLVKDRKPILLSAKPFDLLAELVRARGQVVTKDDLMERIWPDRAVCESNIFSNISLVRRALADGHNDRLDRYIANVSGTGYRFVARVSRVPRGDCGLDEITAEAPRTQRSRGEDPDLFTASESSTGQAESPACGTAPALGSAASRAWRSRSRKNNLPAQPTPLIGRESEVASLVSLTRLRHPRLITLTGAGGSGKTRVAIQAAEEIKGDFADLVCFISLGHVLDWELVAPTMAQALGIRDDGGFQSGSALEAVRRKLENKQALLVVDNFEQVIGAAGLLADLLCWCPRLKIIVTSRMPLNLRGEQRFVVNPLAVPGAKKPKSIEALLAFPSVALLVDRAKGSAPDFELTATDCEAVTGICRKVDGLPLAIELVAPGLRLLSPREVLAWLDHSMDSIGQGPQDMPARQRTIRKTIEWSYNLLSGDEKTLFRRLSVFAGGFTAEAALAVCAEAGGLAVDVPAGLSSLVGKNMVHKGLNPKIPQVVRFSLLETTREFAHEVLSASGEKGEIQKRHADFVCKMVEDTEPRLMSSEVVGALDLLESEFGNIRAALVFAQDSQTLEYGLRIVSALRKFWITRGFVREGIRWAKEIEAASINLSGALRAKFLATAGVLANHRGDYDEAAQLLDQAREIYSRLGFKRGAADALGFTGVARLRQGSFSEAEYALGGALQVSRELEDDWQIGDFLVSTAMLAHSAGDDERSFALNSEAVDYLVRSSNRSTLASALNNLGLLAANRGELPLGKRKLREGLLLAVEIGADPMTMASIESLAEVACLEQRFGNAVTLLAAANMGRRETGAAMYVHNKSECDQLLELAKSKLSASEYDCAWQEGQQMSIDDAVECAVEYAIGDEEEIIAVISSMSTAV